METCDIAILGLGGMGSAVAHAAASRGARVAGFEQFGVAHDQGSSHGDVRVIRRAYFEHPDYIPLLERAYAGWAQLSEETGAPLFEETGVLVAGLPAGETIKGLEACYARQGLPHERLDPTGLAQAWPAFSFPESYEAFWDPLGGFLKAEQCVRAHLRRAQDRGARLFLHESVLEWETLPGGSIAIRTDARELIAGALVITAGPWSGDVAEELGLPLEVVRKVQLWYQGAGVSAAGASDLPVFYAEMPYGALYGFPPYDDKGIKLAEHTGGTPTHADGVDRSLHQEDEALPRRFLNDVLNISEPQLKAFSVCMYTNTPDGNFIIDQHPEYSNVVFGAGFSGHGFKFAPAVGELLTGLALDGAVEMPINFLRASRFQ